MYLVFPRTVMVGNEHFGTWDVALDHDGFYKQFETADEAKEYAEDKVPDAVGPHYLIVETVWWKPSES